MHLDGYKELMQQRSVKEQLEIQVEELKKVNEDSERKLSESEALLRDRKQGILLKIYFVVFVHTNFKIIGVKL